MSQRRPGVKMKMPSKLLVLFIGLAGIVSHRSATVASQPDRGQLTPEQLQLYSDFIDSFSKTHFKFLSSTTFPLELSALPKAAPCLQGLQLDGTEESSKTLHSLGPELFRGHSIQLVNAKEEASILRQRDIDVVRQVTDSMADTSEMKGDPGILALSEITFDKRKSAEVAYQNDRETGHQRAHDPVLS
jgi:hypothetical protein